MRGWRKAGTGKMGNEKTESFDSKGEHRRYQELQLLEKLGAIRNLRTQVKFELTPKIDKERESSYIADFVYFERNSDGTHEYQVVEDCKGFRTPLYILKRKMMRWRYGIEILETKPPRR